MFSKKIVFVFGIAAMLQLAFQSNNYAQEEHINKCQTCHAENEMLPEGFLEDDIHLKANLTCTACHGGDATSDDAEIAMSSANNFIGVPSKKQIPKVCGKCHSDITFMRKYRPRIETDQVAQYYQSVHGIQLKKGDKNVADCTSCHTAHGILSAKDPRSTVYAVNVPNTCKKCHGDAELMDQYGLESNQFEEYSQSVHGIALLKNKDTGAPACNDCHGNHGAIPPGPNSIVHMCGACHLNNEVYFKTSKMYSVFAEEDYHGCEQCHGKHLINKPSEELLGIGEKSLCIDCHEEGDTGSKAAVEIKNSIVSLSGKYSDALNKMEEVKILGMNEAEIGFLLQDAKQKLIQSRTLVHTFDIAKVGERSNEGEVLVDSAFTLARAEISEYDSRKTGFLYALAGLFVLSIGVFLKIKFGN